MEGNNNSSTAGSKSRSLNGSSTPLTSVIELHDKLEENKTMHSDAGASSADNSRQRSCLPLLFERSAMGFLNPRFDSPILEHSLKISFFPHDRRKFRYALVYVALSCLAWIVFFASTKERSWPAHLGGACALAVVSAAFFILTFFSIYSRHYYKVSLVYSLLLCMLSLLRCIYVNKTEPEDTAMSAIGSFSGMVEIVLLLYNLLPLPLYLAVGISLVYSSIYEGLFLWKTDAPSLGFIFGKILLHLCVHVVCVSLHLMSSVRKHSTFWRIGQSTMARKQLKEEKRLKEDIIYSLMPEKVAKEAMQNRNNDDQEQDDSLGGPNGGSGVERGQIVFRQFTMDRMHDVSILFADIVGFTKMSSNKSAEQLVGLLNDLFGRFDQLCHNNNCEKISTLGDCYYCVSGCPKADKNHAKNCLNLGLDMVTAIQEFDEKHNEEVNMRVGIHTGTVLCGIVGTRRFKFDVWSHDVDLANVMESTGQPGQVHISEATYKFLENEYDVEPGETVKDTRKVRNLTEQYDQETCRFGVQQVELSGVTATYFIIGPKDKRDNFQSPSSPSPAISPIDINGGSGREPVSPPAAAEESVLDRRLVKEEEKLDLILADKEEQSQQNQQMRSSLFGSRKKSGTETMLVDRKGFKGDASSALYKEDLALVKAMEEEDEDEGVSTNHFFEPPVNKCTLSFTSESDEVAYRGHTSEDFLSPTIPQTFASPRFNVFLDVWVSTAYYVLLEIVMAIVFGNNLVWLIYLGVSLLFITFQVIAISVSVFSTHGSRARGEVVEEGASAEREQHISRFSRLFGMCYSWVISHILGVVQLAIPLGVVYSRYACSEFSGNPNSEMFFAYAVITAIVHSINFDILSSWMKSMIATIGGVALILLGNLHSCEGDMKVFGTNSGNLNYELILDVTLLLLLVCFLNREIELMTRLAYNGDLKATKDKKQAETEKQLADSLLHDIIPGHVIDQIRLKKEYSQSHKDVGVVFISITNFDEFYDESFEGGKEFLRVLNELFMDYEALFDEKCYKDIEKIKTIGSTFMAASGLDQAARDKNADPKDHLYALMDFCIAVLDTVNSFNEGMFNFDFTLKIGYNVGDIVSGVIGTSKLHFDIWGNTVNVSSRMYSTGVKGRVQVTEETAKILEDRYEFEYRDVISIKGKGEMRTYLLVKKRLEVL